MLRKITVALSFSLFGSIFAADPEKPQRLDRHDLLAFHGNDNAVHRVQTREDWLQRRAENLRVLHPDCPHDLPPEIRQQAYAWIDSVLKPR